MRLRHLRTLLMSALVFVTGAASARAQGVPEPTVMEVRLGQSATLAVRAERQGERLWLPVVELAAALELEVVRATRSRVELRRWPSRTLIVFDRDSSMIRTGAQVVRLSSGALRSADAELLADMATLTSVLRTPFEVSWTDLIIAVPLIDSLPLGRRLAREKARSRLSSRSGGVEADRDVAPLARPLADGAVLDYTLSVPLTSARPNIGWSTAVGLDVLGGSLEVSTGAVTGGTRLPTLSSWTGVWREGRALTQMRIGDGLGTGPLPRLGRGIMFTNSPYVRPALFGLQTLRGDLPPGWTIEAYRNGELVAVDTVGRSSGYQLQLPVLYGENPVDLLAVGPFGQTRALSENLRIGADLLPSNRSEYGVSAAQCRLRQQCIAAGTVDMRVGLTDRWTMRVGVDGVARDTVGLRIAPYFSFVGTPLRSVAVQLDAAAQSRTRVAVNLEPSRSLRLALEQSWFAVDPIDPLVTSRRSTQSSLYAYWRSFGERQTSLEGSIDQSAFLDGGGLTRARLGLGTQAAGLRLQPYFRRDQSSRGGYAQNLGGLEAMMLPRPGLGRYLGAALVRFIGEVDGRGRAVREALTIAMPVPASFRIDAGVAFQRGMRGPLATLTLSRDLNALRSYTMSNFSKGSSSATQSVQGSALLGRGRERPQFVTGPSLQRTGVAGIVYLDRNANGLRDPGEPTVPGVNVQVGTGYARSDADGRYRVWDLVPFIPLPVSVDSTTLPSPLWIPTVRHANIEAGPNRYEPLDIPLVAGGVLEGSIIWRRGSGTSLPPVPLIVRNARGEVIARTSTFSDGEFVLFGVRPGALTVHVDPAWLAAQRTAADSQSVVLGSSDDGATARVAPITISGPASVPECRSAGGARCSGADDDLRDGRSEQRILLTQADLELTELRTLRMADRQQQLAVPAVFAGTDLLFRHANRAVIRGDTMHGDGAAAAPVNPNPEHRRMLGARNRLQGEGSPDHRGGGDDGRLLCVRADRRSDPDRQRGEGDGVRLTKHETESRPGAVFAPDSRHRAFSVLDALVPEKRTVEPASRTRGSGGNHRVAVRPSRVRTTLPDGIRRAPRKSVVALRTAVDAAPAPLVRYRVPRVTLSLPDRARVSSRPSTSGRQAAIAFLAPRPAPTSKLPDTFGARVATRRRAVSGPRARSVVRRRTGAARRAAPPPADTIMCGEDPC